MNITRQLFDTFYDAIKPIVFASTSKTPKKASDLFSWSMKKLSEHNLEDFILYHNDNKLKSKYEISTAGGFDKDFSIPLNSYGALGFDRVVLGTTTGEGHDGNDEPTIERLVSDETLFNDIGLKNKSSAYVSEKLKHADNKYGVKVSASIMPKPKLNSKEEELEDLENSVKAYSSVDIVDTIQLNISCPNTGEDSSNLAKKVDEQLAVVHQYKGKHQKIEIKVSPDSTDEEYRSIIQAANNYESVKGFVVSNTSKKKRPEKILHKKKRVDGGMSGNSLYPIAKDSQYRFEDILAKQENKYYLRAVGGIDSKRRIRERETPSVIGYEIMTGMIFKGTRFIREARKELHDMAPKEQDYTKSDQSLL